MDWSLPSPLALRRWATLAMRAPQAVSPHNQVWMSGSLASMHSAMRDSWQTALTVDTLFNQTVG